MRTKMVIYMKWVIQIEIIRFPFVEINSPLFSFSRFGRLQSLTVVLTLLEFRFCVKYFFFPFEWLHKNKTLKPEK